MPKVHHFQRYSSPENTVTNNTLQLLSRIYHYSTEATSRLLSEILNVDIEIGVSFTQQKKTKGAVPDGLITQNSFQIIIESKVDSPVGERQLVRHADAFKKNTDKKILILLTKLSIGTQEKTISDSIRIDHPDVIFKNITYESICKSLKNLFKPHETSIIELANDYIEYCNDTKLFNQCKNLMRIVPCSQSYGINTKHSLYFQPNDRGYTDHSYVGLYANKTVQALIKIESVFDVEIKSGVLHKTLVQGKDSTIHDTNIIMAAKEAKADNGWDIDTGHRFFCGPLHETNYVKTTPGGIMGARLVNLRDVLGDFTDTSDIATKLSEKTWE